MGINMKVEKIKKKLRKLEYNEKIELMDWLNNWYSHECEPIG